MDIKSIGSFLKELRKEKGLTQEQFAEIMYVSNRTVSRWETGRNAPDLDILIKISEYYDVSLSEILEGKRKGENMNNEMKENILKVADYSNEEKIKILKRMHILFIVGLCTFLIYFATLIYEPENPSNLFELIRGLSLGISFGMIINGVIMTSKYRAKIVAFKQRLLKMNRK